MGWQKARASASLALYLREALNVAITGNLHGICRDPKDDMVFECAVNASAEIIVSGDKDLLSVQIYRGTRVLTARQYVDHG